jgi:polyhydroxybutyrate depolymerase
MRLHLSAAALAAMLLLRAAPAGAESLALSAGGLARTAEILAPPGAATDRPAALILLHGRLGTGAQILRQAGIGARPGLVVAAPDGHRRSWASGHGETPADLGGIDDIRFLRALIGALVARHGVDPARVYVAGMSNGGFMAARLACEAPDLLAGIAIVGATSGMALAQGCRPGRPVRVLLIHGTADPLAGADGSAPRTAGRIMGAAGAARFWAATQGCTAAAAPRALPHAGAPDGTVAFRTDFAPCRGGARVAFIEIRGGGHVWPGRENRLPARLVGPSSGAVDASREILAFFGLGAN